MNPAAPLSSQSLARRVTLLSIGMIALVLVGASAAIGIVTQRNAHEQVVQTVADKAASLVSAADTTDDTDRELVRRVYHNFRSNFEPELTLDAASGELKNYGVALNNDTGVVDKFTRDTGGVATVFARKGDDFIRITTSLRKQDGERALGTTLDRAHPAYALAMAGEPYTGRADLFGKPYMTHYQPVKDAAGKVVGILFVGNDISLFLSGLQKQVTEARFFDSGGFYVVDPRKSLAEAVFIIHPTARGKKVLEAFPQSEKFFTELAAAPDGYVDEATAILGEGTTVGDEWAVMRKTRANGWWVVAEVSNEQAMAKHWSGMVRVWGLMALAIVMLGAGLFFLLRRAVSQPLRELTGAVTTVAHGDLSQAFRSERRDEIGILVREVESMRQRFVQMMQQVRTSVESISTAASEIAQGNSDLSQRTEQTASNLQTTASSMEELTGTVQQTSNSAQTANKLASSASEVASLGGKVVSEVVATMDEINASSKKINDIIGVIDGIAFQTNILALNAAVEAARAGEQGRGFAVVASEVRSLAQRSAAAAREIKDLISASVEKVEGGTKLVAEAGQTMTEIVGSVQRVSDIIEEIRAATSEQSRGIAQVNTAVNQLDQMTQQNSALVEQSAAAADSLREQTHRLANAMRAFKLSDKSMPPALVAPSL